jgi:hypothetical protein
MATILTADGATFPITETLEKESKVIHNILEEFGGDGLVPLPNINSKIFKKILYFSHNQELEQYDDVKDVMVAADYIAYDALVDHCAKHIAQVVIKGKSAEQIREYFKNT